MPHFLTQWTYKDEEVRQMVIHPQNREEVVRLAVEALGGSLHGFYFCLGEYDGACITEFPDKETAMACLMLVMGHSAARTLRTTPLLTQDEAQVAMQKANEVFDRTPYEPPSRTRTQEASA
jgi:uncharacterized protein with GYD domain